MGSTTIERLADRVFLAMGKRQRFVVAIECMTRWDEGVLWSLLSKVALLAEAERLPVELRVFVLKRRDYRSPQGTFCLQANGRPVQKMWFREVLLWETVPEPGGKRSLLIMPLYPMARHGQSGRDAIRYAAKAITEHAPSVDARGDLLTLLGVFGDFAYPAIRAFDLIGRRQMEELEEYQWTWQIESIPFPIHDGWTNSCGSLSGAIPSKISSRTLVVARHAARNPNPPSPLHS